MTIRDQHGGFNEIGRIDTTDSSIVDWQKQKLATRGQIKHAWIDPKFRGMGLATKMYGEAMKQAPRGRLVSDNAQFDGGYAIWNRLQRNKGYKIRENPKADGADDGFLSRDKRPLFIGRINPAARKQSNLSAKLRLRELARGDFAIPALGKLLKDRSFLEQFATGKRGPKMGDLAVGRFQMNKRALRTKNGRTTLSGYPKSPLDVSVSKVVKTPAGKEIPGDMERIRQQWVSDSYRSGPETLQVTNQMLHQARQRARDKVAKIIRKGRAGGDVYEEVNRS